MVLRPRPWSWDQDHGLETKTAVLRPRPRSWDQDRGLETKTMVLRTVSLGKRETQTKTQYIFLTPTATDLFSHCMWLYVWWWNVMSTVQVCIRAIQGWGNGKVCRGRVHANASCVLETCPRCQTLPWTKANPWRYMVWMFYHTLVAVIAQIWMRLPCCFTDSCM